MKKFLFVVSTVVVVSSLAGCNCSGGGTTGTGGGGGTGGDVNTGGGTGGGSTGGGTGGGSGGNHAPTITSISPVTVDEGQSTTVTVTATDPDGDAVTLTLNSPPSWASITGATITLAPTFADSGDYTLSVTASDGKGGTSQATFQVTVNNVGRAPVWTAISPVTLDEGTTQTVTLSATDPDGESVTYALTQSPPAWASLTGAVVTLAPDFNAAGTHSLFVKATTTSGGTALTSLAVIVNNVNRAPAFTSASTVSVDEQATKTFSVTATDPDGDTVTLTATSLPSWAQFSNGTLTMTPGCLDSGSAQATFDAQDPSGAKTSTTLAITVNNVNCAPTFSAVPPQTVNEGQTLNVPFTTTDVDGDPVSFRAPAASPWPAWITINATLDGLKLAPDFTAAGASPYTITVEATDGLGGHVVTQTVTITVVNVNQPPTFPNPASASVNETASKTVTISATDPDGDTVTITGVGLPAWAQLTGTSLTMTPGCTDSGSHTLNFQAADPQGAKATAQMTVTVVDVNCPPTLTAIPNQSVDEGGTSTVLFVATDPDNDPITFRAPSGSPWPAWAALNGGGNGVVLAPDFSAAGASPYTLTVEAVDAPPSGSPHVVSQSFTVTVVNVNRPPDLAIIDDVTVAELASPAASLSLASKASDPDGEPLTWQVTGLPAGVGSFDQATKTISLSPATTTWKLSPVAVTVSVTDPHNATTSRTFNVFITSTNTAPILDGGMSQIRVADGTTLLPGGDAGASAITIRASVLDLQDDPVQLEVEVQPLATAFTGVASYSGILVDPLLGIPPSVVIPSPAAGDYHWQVRAVDSSNLASAWMPYVSGGLAFFVPFKAIEGSIAINNGAATTGSVGVQVSQSLKPGVGATGIPMLEFSNDNITFTNKGAYDGGVIAWNLDATGGTGVRTVYVRATDNAAPTNTVTFTDTIVLDLTPPTISSFVIKNGAVATNTAATTVSFTISDVGSGISKVELSNDGTTFTTVTPSTTAWTLSNGDGTKTVTLRVTDDGGNVTTATDTIVLDTAVPTVSAVLVSDATTNSTAWAGALPVKVQITGADTLSGITQLCLGNTSPPSTCSTVTGSGPWTITTFSLSAGDSSAKTVYVQAKDVAGNLSAVASDTIGLDTSAPTVSAVVINGGATYTKQAAVTIVTTASDTPGSGVADIAFSTDNGATFGAWVPYVPSGNAFNLPGGDGAKTVVVKVRDVAGHPSDPPNLSDGIYLDATLPQIASVTLAQGAVAVKSASAVQLDYSYSDLGGSVPVTVEASNDGVTFTPVNLVSPSLWNLTAGDGTKTVTLRVTDGAGNVAIATDSVVLDTVAPTLSTCVINSGASATNSTSVTVTSSAADNVGGSGLRAICLTNIGQSEVCITPYGASVPWTLTTGDGNKAPTCVVEDYAGNRSVTLQPSILLDTVPPTLTSIAVNSGAAWATGTGATITAVSGDSGGANASGVVSIAFSTDGSTFGSFVTLSSNQAPFTLPGGDGLKTVWAKVKDAAGNVSVAPFASDTITLDTTPPSGSVVIAGNAAYVTGTGTTYTATATDVTSGLAQMCVKEGAASPAANDPCWVGYSGSATAITLSAVDGTKTLYAWFKDNAGLISVSAATDNIVLDTVAPSGTVTIAGGAAWITSLSTTTTVSASDATSGLNQMCVRATPATQPAANDSCWVTYSTAATALNFAAGEGTRTVYAWFKDAAGLISASAATDTVGVDTVAPSGTVSIAGGATYATSTATTTTVSASDATSLVAQMCVKQSAATPAANDACWVAYTTTAQNLTLTGGEGTNTVYAWFKDNAGLISSPATTDTIIQDTVAPTGGSIVLAGNATYTTTASITFVASATDATTAVTQMCAKQGAATPASNDPCWQAYSTAATNYSITGVDGLKTVHIWFMDSAGNISATPAPNDTITLDTAAPTGGAVTLAGGANYLNGLSTTWTASATDATSGLYQMCVREGSAAPPSGDPCWITYDTAAHNITLGSGDGAKTVYAWFKDNAGLMTAVAATDGITVDTVAPTGTVSIAGAAANTATAATTYTVSASDATSGLFQMCVTESATVQPASNDPCWITYTANASPITFTGVDGTKTAYAWFKDASGLISTSAATDTIVLDRAAPVSTSVVIAGNATYTNTQATTYVVAASDATTSVAFMCVGEQFNLQPASNDPCWVAFSTAAQNISLNATNGTKTVYAWFKDAAGNMTASSVSDTIILDTQAPTGTINITGGAAGVNTINTTYTASASDTLSGMSQMCAKTAATTPTAGDSCWVTYTTSATAITLLTGEGTKTVYAWFKDVAGNISSMVQDTIILDTVLPTTGSIALTHAVSGTTYATSTAVTYVASTTDTNPYQMCAKESSATPTLSDPCWVAYSTAATNFTLSGGDANKTVYVWFKDIGGNLSNPSASDSIILDTTAPTGTITLVTSAPVAGYTYDTTPDFTVAASDTNGVAQMCFKNVNSAPAAADACWEALATPKTAWAVTTSDGSKTVYAWFKDNPGNISTVTSTTFVVDTVAPTPPTTFNATAGHRQIAFSWSGATDGTSGVYDYEVGVGTSTGGESYANGFTVGTSQTVTDLSNEVLRYTAVKARDKAGNVSAASGEALATPRYPFRDFQYRSPTALSLYDVYQASATTGVAVGQDGTVIKSTDSWSTTVRRDALSDVDLTGITGGENSSILYTVGVGGFAAYSDDVGETWTVLSTPSASTMNASSYAGLVPCSGLCFGSTYAHVAVGVSGQIWLSTRVWSSFTGWLSPTGFSAVTSPTANTLNGVTRNASTGTLIAVGNAGTILRSTDQGATWSTVSAPSGYTAMALRAVVAVPGTSTFFATGKPPALGNAALLTSTNDGVTWTAVTGVTDISGYGIDAYSASSVWLTGTDLNTSNTEVFTKTAKWNGSALTVQTIPSGVVTQYNGYGISTTNGVNVVVAGYQGLLAATGTGSAATPTWWNFGDSPERNTIYKLSGVPSYTTRVFAAEANGFLGISGDYGATWSNTAIGGVNWNSVDTPSYYYAAAVGNSGTVAHWCYSGSANCPTAGWSLDTTPAATPGLTEVACITDTRCIAVGGNGTTGAIWSRNGTAHTWTDTGYAGTAQLQSVTTYIDSGGSTRHFLTVGSAGTYGYCTETSSNCNSSSLWTFPTAITGTPALRSVANNGNSATPVALAVGGTASIYRSTDHGVTWAVAGTNAYTSDLWDVSYGGSGNVWYAAGGTGVVLRSTDNGATWSKLVLNMGAALRTVMVGSVNSYIWVGGAAGTVARSTTSGL